MGRVEVEASRGPELTAELTGSTTLLLDFEFNSDKTERNESDAYILKYTIEHSFARKRVEAA